MHISARQVAETTTVTYVVNLTVDFVKHVVC